MPETKRSLLRLIEIDKLLHNSPNGVRVCDIKSRLDKGVTDRTIQSDLKILMSSKENDGFDAPIIVEHAGRERYYKYEDPHFSIFTPPINDEEKRILQDMFRILERFENIPEKEWLENLKIDNIDGLGFDDSEQCVEFEETEDVLFSEKLHTLYDMIVQKNAIIMEYKPYTKASYMVTVSPYYLKQFNRRWFLIAKTSGYDSFSVYSLDRIGNIKKATKQQYESSNTNFKEYFEDIIGVTIKNNEPVETIILAVKKEHYPYIESKPIHATQRLRSNYITESFSNENYMFIEIKVIKNKELIARILEYGNQLFVVEPESIREEVANIIAEQNRIYNN